MSHNRYMKEIDALDLHGLNTEQFKLMIGDSDKVSIMFFGKVIGYIETPGDEKPVIEISLPELCRKSKRLLQYELLALGGRMAIASGQQGNKTIVAHLVAA